MTDQIPASDREHWDKWHLMKELEAERAVTTELTAKLKEASDVLLMMHAQFNDDKDTVEHLKTHLAAAKLEAQEYRKALEWYSDPGNFCVDDKNTIIATAYSRGKISRKAKQSLNQYPAI